MLLLSELFLDGAIRIKAPKGKIFEIDTIYFNNGMAVAGGLVFVLDYVVEEEITDAYSSVSEFLAAFSTDIAGSFMSIPDVKHRTKYLTITKAGTGGVVSHIAIYGELVKAPRTELIFEWFRKGR